MKRRKPFYSHEYSALNLHKCKPRECYSRKQELPFNLLRKFSFHAEKLHGELDSGANVVPLLDRISSISKISRCISRCKNEILDWKESRSGSSPVLQLKCVARIRCGRFRNGYVLNKSLISWITFKRLLFTDKNFKTGRQMRESPSNQSFCYLQSTRQYTNKSDWLIAYILKHNARLYEQTVLKKKKNCLYGGIRRIKVPASFSCVCDPSHAVSHLQAPSSS
jgi:hypothetical protein